MMRLLVFWMILLGLVQATPRMEALDTQWSGSLKAGGVLELQTQVVNRSQQVCRGVRCQVMFQGRPLGQLSTPADLAPQGRVLLEGKVQLPSDLQASLEGKSPREVLQLQCSALRVADLKPADIALEERPEGTAWVVTLINQGSAPVANLPYRLSWDGQVVQEKKLLQPLGPGESHQFTYLDSKNKAVGKHRLVCEVDPQGELEDGDPGNNRYQLDWQGASRVSDLQIRNWQFTPETLTVGSPTRLLVAVENTGEVEMFRLPLQLKVDGKIEAEKKFFQTLAPGGESELSLNWIPTQAGEHKVSLVCQGQSTPPRPVTVQGRAGYKLQLRSANVPKHSRLAKDWVIDLVVHNGGSSACQSLRAVLWANGSRVWSSRLTQPLEADQEANLSLRWSADTVGPQQLRIELVGQGSKVDEQSDLNQLYNVVVLPGEE